MKAENSKLWIGLGIGLLAGAAIGVYLALSEEDKSELADGINRTVAKAKETIKKALDDGLDELDNAMDKVNSVATAAIARAKAGETSQDTI
jgi:F0F1-type ATP synthase membrane subunit b/b'